MRDDAERVSGTRPSIHLDGPRSLCGVLASGRIFAIGCAVEDDPLALRFYDGPEVPVDGPLGAQWAGSEAGNWSGDWS